MNRIVPLTNIDHKLLDGVDEVRAAKQATLPDVQTGTTTINVSGMLGPLDVPNTNQIDAMTYSFQYDGSAPDATVLHRPGMHQHELRVAEDMFDTVAQANKLVAVKYRMAGMLTGVTGGDIEKGGQKTSTATYQCTRFEKYVDGAQVLLVDKINCIYRVNGTDYAADVRAILQ